MMDLDGPPSLSLRYLMLQETLVSAQSPPLDDDGAFFSLSLDIVGYCAYIQVRNSQLAKIPLELPLYNGASRPKRRTAEASNRGPFHRRRPISVACASTYVVAA